MPEKTYAQKIIEKTIEDKKAKQQWAEYSEFYNDYNDIHDYYDIDYGWPENRPLPREDFFVQSVYKKIKAQIQSLYQKFALTNRR